MNQGFWQVLSGGLVAVVSIFLTNYFNNKRVRDQMTFDKEQKALERLTKLRTDVYLDAAAKIVQMNSFLPSMAQVDPLTLAQRTEFIDFSAATAKLSVVAEPETVYQVNELVGIIGKAYVRTMVAASPVQSLDADIARAQKSFEAANVDVTEAIRLKTELLREASPDQERLGALNEEIGFYRRRMDAAESKRAGLAEQRSKALLKFNEKVLPMIMESRAPTINCLARIRSDLGLSTHTGKWKDQMDRQAAEAAAELQSLMSAIAQMEKS